MSSAFTLIEDAVLGSAAASITFSDLGGYTKFRLTLYFIQDAGVSGEPPRFRFNGDTGTNYARQGTSASSTTVAGARVTGQTSIDPAYSSSPVASTQGLITLEISKPLTTTPARVTAAASFMGAGPAIVYNASSAEWNNTADLISSIAVYRASNEFAANTRAVLEGAA